jgi:hypothetical protein
MWIVIRRWIRKVWDARGGGLYAFGFVVAFVWLEFTTLVNEFSSSTGITGFFSGQLIQFLLRFTVDSLVNTAYALIWPVRIISYSPPWCLSFLAQYVVFTYVLKNLERLLFHEADTVAAEQPAPGAETSDTKD